MESSRPMKGTDQAKLAPAPSKWTDVAAAMLSAGKMTPRANVRGRF